MSVNLDPQQREALELCTDIDRRIVVVSGAAGTGKTTIQENLVRALQAAGYRVALCSPTGKAARRQTQATGIPAVTIHKLLEFPMPGEVDQTTGKALAPSVPKRSRSNPLEFDVVIADEYTMVPHMLHRQLIDSLPAGGCLRLFGDRNQLRPVEADKILQGSPSPFEEIIEKFPTAILETVHRQAEGSDVLENAHRILRGFMPKRATNFRITFSTRQPQSLIEEIEGLEQYNFTSTSCQVIVPTRVRWTGTYALNALLQKRFNPNFRMNHADVLDLPRHRWEEDQPVAVAIGDKVIWTKNDYNLELMNGDQGIILDISEYGDISVKFDTHDDVSIIPPLVQYEDSSGSIHEYDPRKQMDLAWAITTHKAQGSEYRAVIYVTSKEAQFLLWRGNFYTAVTRAKECFSFIGDQVTMRYCVARAKELSYTNARNSTKGKKK